VAADVQDPFPLRVPAEEWGGPRCERHSDEPDEDPVDARVSVFLFFFDPVDIGSSGLFFLFDPVDVVCFGLFFNIFSS